MVGAETVTEEQWYTASIQRVSNTELSQYINALKVQFQHQPRNYREVLQDVVSQVPSIGVDTFRKASEVSVKEKNQE